MITDPNTPSLTEAPETRTLNLSDIGNRYLRTLQRMFDVASYLIEGSRLVSERGYDDMARSIRFLPSQKDHRGFDAAREEAERYLLKNLLNDVLNLVVPLLEDLRGFCALADWQKGDRNPEVAQRILSTERSEFLKLNLQAKFNHLRDVTGLTSPLTPGILALTNVGACLASRSGVVSERDVTSGGELAIRLVSLEVVPTDPAKIAEGAAAASPRFGELRKTFTIGETIRFEKTEYLNIIATVALFATSLLTATQNKLKGTIPSA